jgi:flagellar hook-associated protein 2
LTGQTGAASAFELGGVAGLSYDPAAPSSSGGLQATQSAADARYAVDGGPVRTSSSNSNVTVTSGLVATLTATGPMTVSVPFGYAQASGAAQTLVNSVNTLLSGLAGATATEDPSTGDANPASQLADIVDQVLSESTAGTGQFSSLADIGIAVQSDGTLAIDRGKLQNAYAADPAGTRELLDTAAGTIREVLSGTGGAGDAIKSQIQDLLTSIRAQMPSLADILQSQTGTTDTMNDFFGTTGQSDSLLSALQGNPNLAAALSQSTAGQSLLSSLGLGSSDADASDTTTTSGQASQS